MNPSQIISDDSTEQFMAIMDQTILEAANAEAEAANAEAEAANAKAEAANAKAEVARLKAEVAQLETSGKPCPFCKKLYVPKYKTLRRPRPLSRAASSPNSTSRAAAATSAGTMLLTANDSVTVGCIRRSIIMGTGVVLAGSSSVHRRGEQVVRRRHLLHARGHTVRGRCANVCLSVHGTSLGLVHARPGHSQGLVHRSTPHRPVATARVT